MEGRYGSYTQGNSGWTSLRSEEFQEEDIWDVFNGRKDYISKVGSPESSMISPRQLPNTTSMKIPRANNNSTQEPKIFHHSAPVNIPDWSKIYGNNSKKADASWLDDDDDDDDDHGDDGGGDGDGDDEDDDDDDGIMMPPHEWVAKKLARSKTFSFSVCEGAGRTLKGRDLSRVRNIVLTKTGFLE